MKKSILLFIFSFLFLSTISNAVTVIPTDVRNVTTTTVGVRATLPLTVRNAGVTTYASRAVVLSRSSMGVLAKARMATPWGLAIQAAMIAYGYTVNSNNEVVSGGSNNIPSAQGTCTPVQVVPGTSSSGTLSDCTLRVVAAIGWDGASGYTAKVIPEILNGNTWNFKFLAFGSTYGSFATWQPNSLGDMNGYTGFPAQSDFPDIVSDEDVGTALLSKPSTTPALTRHLLTDPVTQKVNTNIVEIADMLADFINDFNATYDADPQTNPTTDSDLDTGLSSETDLQDESLQLVASGTDELIDLINDTDTTTEVTGQCAELPDSLGCIDTTGDFPDQVLTEAIIPFDITPVSLQSGSGCPTSDTLNLNMGTSEFDYQPICLAATTASPLILLGFSLIALFIIGGTRL